MFCSLLIKKGGRMSDLCETDISPFFNLEGENHSTSCIHNHNYSIENYHINLLNEELLRGLSF